MRTMAVLALMLAMGGCAGLPTQAAPIEVTYVAPKHTPAERITDFWRERHKSAPYVEPAFARPETRWDYWQKWQKFQAEKDRLFGPDVPVETLR